MKLILQTLLAHGILVLLVLGLSGLTYRLWKVQHDADKVVAAAYAHQHALNDSVQVLLAAQGAQRKELQGLYDAAKVMNGKLVAGVRLKVAKRDTVLVHDTLPTITTPDSVRTASFSDSTFAGTVTGVVKAPPYPAPLGVTFSLLRPAFSPSVGFVKVAGRYVAVVVWQNERYQVDAPFVQSLAAQQKRFVVFAEQYVDAGKTFTTRAGVEFRLPLGLSAVAVLDQRWEVGQPTRLNAGVRKEF